MNVGTCILKDLSSVSQLACFAMSSLFCAVSACVDSVNLPMLMRISFVSSACFVCLTSDSALAALSLRTCEEATGT